LVSSATFGAISSSFHLNSTAFQRDSPENPPLKLLVSGHSGRRRWRQCDRIAELFEASNVLALEPSCVSLVEVISPQIQVWLMLAQQVIEDDEDAMGQREDCTPFATAARHAMIEGDQTVARGTG
jgi:hypothetical protein